MHGTIDDLPEVLADVEPDEVMIAIPSAPGTLRAAVVSACRARGITVRTVPTVFELVQTGGQLTRQLRDVKVEDVLGRDPVRMEIESVGGYLTGRTVLVTGAGGSIGSELCRQISRVNPDTLVLLDSSEANLFEIERELRDERHVLFSRAVLADCKDEERMREVFAQFRPEVVFHAAAFKHVELMQRNPVEAVRNNALATRMLTEIAGDYGVGRSCWSRPTRRSRRPRSWARRRRSPSGPSRPRRSAIRRRRTARCASATCSAPRVR